MALRVAVVTVSDSISAGQGEDDHITANLSPSEVPDHPLSPLRTTLHGNAGDDSFKADDGFVDHLFGDDGNDSAAADQNDVLTEIEVTA